MKYWRNLFFSFAQIFGVSVYCQNTVGLIEYQNGNTPGYVLFSPMSDSTTYLIDKCGEVVHEWHAHNRPGLGAQLSADGYLYRTCNIGNSTFQRGGRSGRIEKYDWNSNLVWSYDILDTLQCSHHDFHIMPNGHILMIVWDRIMASEAIAFGKNPSALGTSDLWGERLIEIEPVGTNSVNVVWEWSVWDHLIQHFDENLPNYGLIAENPQRVDINYFPGGNLSPDWLHFNSVVYNQNLDQIMVSVHTLSEVWIIDHSTTTAEASTSLGGNSGKGGDLLYRYGNPEAYNLGTANSQVLYSQHHATWVPQGHPFENQIMIFNNGLNAPSGDFSSVEIISPPILGFNYEFIPGSGYSSAAVSWQYNPQTELFTAGNLSGVFSLGNGNFLATVGPTGNFIEITNTGETVWRYRSPVSGNGILQQGSNLIVAPVFRAEFIANDFSGLQGQNLQANGELEENPQSPSICELLGVGVDEMVEQDEIYLYPNPTQDYLKIVGVEKGESLEIYNSAGVLVHKSKTQGNTYELNICEWASGLYIIRIMNEQIPFIK